MRWNKQVTLSKVVTIPDEEGVPRETVVDSVVVFANTRHLGLQTWAAARSMGLHADSSVEVRSLEYDDHNRCVLDGVEYEVEYVYDTGEYSTLTLKRRLRNAG